MRESRYNNGNIPILYIEFVDEAGAENAEFSPAALIGPVQYAHSRGWEDAARRSRAALARRRFLAAGMGTLLGLGALTGVSLAAQAGQAQQRALALAPLALTTASYSPDPAGNGYDLLVGLLNAARDPVTLLAVAVHQPGMTMVEGEGPIVIGPAARTEIIVGGWFDCTGPSAPDATTVLVTLAGQGESVFAQRLGLPATADLPASWTVDRAAYCRNWSGGSTDTAASTGSDGSTGAEASAGHDTSSDPVGSAAEHAQAALPGDGDTGGR